MELLKTNNWIDNRTRAVLVEFATYNAQVSFPGLFWEVVCSEFSHLDVKKDEDTEYFD